MRVSAAIASMPAASITARWRSAAGSSIVRAIEAAVSVSMFARVEYCSAQTSKRDSSSRCESTSYFSKAVTVWSVRISGSASGVVRRFLSPRRSASSCHSSA